VELEAHDAVAEVNQAGTGILLDLAFPGLEGGEQDDPGLVFEDAVFPLAKSKPRRIPSDSS
jgi:hypothetical protein